MTDDSNARYRSTEPFSSRATGPDGQGSDPLAELARLIGQSEQFSEAARDSRTAAPLEPHYDDPPQSDPAHGDRQAYDPRYDAPYSHAAAPASEWHGAAPPSYDPFAAASHQAQPAADPADHGYQHEPSQPRSPLSDITFPSAPPRFPGAQPALAGFDTPPLEAGSRYGRDYPPPPFGSDSAPFPPPSADELYDDAPQGGRRKGMITVVAVLCLAVVGTGAAFGYRTWVGGPGVKSPPPVIKASADPKKVAPPPQTDPSANKISYDRFGDRGQNEKVVVREEKPVDVNTTRGAPARAAVPGALNPASAAATAAAPPAGNPPSVLTEPKRVRTVPIRPDLPDTSAAMRPQMATTATAPAPAPQRQASIAATTPSNAPLDLANPAAPPPQVRAPAVRREPAAPSANAPLSLAPDSSPLPAPSRSAPARVASAPAGGNGSYLVQVSSQRSEADAQAAFRSVKSKYSNILGDRQPVIKRADLAGKGTYYRAMVGPFTTRDQAIQLCSSLKAAGGDCVVQAN